MRKLFACLLVVGASLGAAVAFAEVVPESKAIQEAQSPVRGVDGYCVDVTSTPAIIWPDAAPARLQALQGEVRWVEVLHADTTDDDPVCTSLGSTLGASMACALTDNDNTPGLLMSSKTSRPYLVQRTRRSGATAADTPDLWADAISAGNVLVCVTVGF